MVLLVRLIELFMLRFTMTSWRRNCLLATAAAICCLFAFLFPVAYADSGKNTLVNENSESSASAATPIPTPSSPASSSQLALSYEPVVVPAPPVDGHAPSSSISAASRTASPLQEPPALDSVVPPNTSWVMAEKHRMCSGGSPSDKLVLSYPLEGCHSPGDAFGDDDEGEVLHGQEARSAAVTALKFRVAQLLRQKQLKKHTESLHSTDLMKAAAVEDVSPDVSAMQTQYLSALQMEVITTLPKGISPAEVLGITPELPCVQKGFSDATKFIEEPDLPLASHEQQQQQMQHQQLQQQADQHRQHSKRHLQEFSISELGLRVVKSVEGNDSSAFIEPRDATLKVPPNDPFFLQQWNLHEASPFGINAERAWRLWTGAQRPMVIAIIDSGCDLDHPDLKNKRWKNPGEVCGDGIDNDANGYVDDCYGWVSHEKSNPQQTLNLKALTLNPKLSAVNAKEAHNLKRG